MPEQDYARCLCRAALQWDWCQDNYFDPENKKWHNESDVENDAGHHIVTHSCYKCGSEISILSTDGNDLVRQHHLADIDWEAPPYCRQADLAWNAQHPRLPNYLYAKKPKTKRGYDHRIVVWRLVKSEPHFIAEKHIINDTTYGDLYEALWIIVKHTTDQEPSLMENLKAMKKKVNLYEV